jgi:hypothetical protein
MNKRLELGEQKGPLNVRVWVVVTVRKGGWFRSIPDARVAKHGS